MNRCQVFVLGLAAITAGFALTAAPAAAEEKSAEASDNRVFELRIYTTNPGKLDALNTRFRDHTCKLFEKHGMTLIGFWTPNEGEQAENTLIYLLAFPSREARDKAFTAFRNDPAWQKAYQESIADGKIVKKVESKFLSPTDYSQIK